MSNDVSNLKKLRVHVRFMNESNNTRHVVMQAYWNTRRWHFTALCL